MMLSLHFGMYFWLNEYEDFCYCPAFEDSTADHDNWGFVSEWDELEGVDLDKLFTIHRHLVIDKVTEYLKKNKLKIMKSCVNTQREMINYQWEQPSASKIDLNQPERPLKKDDHAMDSMRYMVAYAYDRVPTEKRKSVEERFIESIIIEPEQEYNDWSDI